MLAPDDLSVKRYARASRGWKARPDVYLQVADVVGFTGVDEGDVMVGDALWILLRTEQGFGAADDQLEIEWSVDVKYGRVGAASFSSAVGEEETG